jgi:hypothetical protein
MFHLKFQSSYLYQNTKNDYKRNTSKCFYLQTVSQFN